jgi:acylphosphatase
MREAARCRVAGFARNLPDGRVEVVAEGEERNLLKIVSWCRKGPPMARVEGVEVSWGEPTGQYQGFNPG